MHIADEALESREARGETRTASRDGVRVRADLPLVMTRVPGRVRGFALLGWWVVALPSHCPTISRIGFAWLMADVLFFSNHPDQIQGGNNIHARGSVVSQQASSATIVIRLRELYSTTRQEGMRSLTVVVASALGRRGGNHRPCCARCPAPALGISLPSPPSSSSSPLSTQQQGQARRASTHTHTHTSGGSGGKTTRRDHRVPLLVGGSLVGAGSLQYYLHRRALATTGHGGATATMAAAAHTATATTGVS